MNLLKILGFNRLEQSYIKIIKQPISTDIQIWLAINIILPLLIVVIPFILGVYIEDISYTFWEIVFNGGITLIAINILAVSITYPKKLLHMNDNELHKAYRLDIRIDEIKRKFLVYEIALLIFATLFYLLQIIYNDKYNFNLFTIGLYLFVIIHLFFSTYVSKHLFILSFSSHKHQTTFDLLFNQLEAEQEELLSNKSNLEEELKNEFK